MLSRADTFAAIDVGTTKVCTLVGDLTPERHLRILGVGITPSAGVSKGMVDNIQQATEAILNSVEKAERSSGTRIIAAHVGIAGSHIGSLNNRGVISIPGRHRPIAREDIARALEAARSVSIPTNRDVLHVLPRYYMVDGQEHVSDPSGMHGQRLDVEAHIVTGTMTAVQNLTKCVEGAGVQAEDLVLAPLASAAAVLEEEERQQGVVLADIGGGTTDIAAFVDGSIHHTAVLPVGGYHLTHDLVAGLRAPFSAAEEAKERHGHALPSTLDPEEMVEVEAFGNQRRKTVSRRRMAEIIQARAEEMLEMIFLEVKRAGFDEMLAAGLVLTGGTANLQGLAQLAEQVLRMPVRIGVPRELVGLADALANPTYATSVGLLQWAIGESERAVGWSRPRPAPALADWLRRLGGWVRALLPQ
ncbi:MAG: cell division protein FtsA [Dehalococcoidia bacterium]